MAKAAVTVVFPVPPLPLMIVNCFILYQALYCSIKLRKVILELRQGIYWLLWRLYEPESFVERFATFFKSYESSSIRKRLAIPKIPFDWGTMLFIVRFIKFIALKCTSAQRGIFWKMLSHARRSSHPRRFAILIENFLELLSTREKLGHVCSEDDAIHYPG